MYSSLVKFHKYNEKESKILNTDYLLIVANSYIEHILNSIYHFMQKYTSRDIKDFKQFIHNEFDIYCVFINISSDIYNHYRIINDVNIYINEYNNLCNFDVKLHYVKSLASYSYMYNKLRFQITCDVINHSTLIDELVN